MVLTTAEQQISLDHGQEEDHTKITRVHLQALEVSTEIPLKGVLRIEAKLCNTEDLVQTIRAHLQVMDTTVVVEVFLNINLVWENSRRRHNIKVKPDSEANRICTRHAVMTICQSILSRFAWVEVNMAVSKIFTSREEVRVMAEIQRSVRLQMATEADSTSEAGKCSKPWPM